MGGGGGHETDQLPIVSLRGLVVSGLIILFLPKY